jgi:maltose O-acetyltransferase
MIFFPHEKIRKGKVTVGERVSGINLKDVFIDATGDIIIGEEVIFSQETRIYTHMHPMKKEKSIYKQTKEQGVTFSNLVIGNDVYFGSRCMILPQVTNIPNGTVIAAGAVLTKNPTCEFEIWGGNPAVKIGERK